jgi:hypothetical protein
MTVTLYVQRLHAKINLWMGSHWDISYPVIPFGTSYLRLLSTVLCYIDRNIDYSHIIFRFGIGSVIILVAISQLNFMPHTTILLNFEKTLSLMKRNPYSSLNLFSNFASGGELQ